MKQLSDGEKRYYQDLEENLEEHVARYIKEKEGDLAEGREEDMRSELKKLEVYQEATQRGEVSDLLINMQFSSAKIDALRLILGILEK